MPSLWYITLEPDKTTFQETQQFRQPWLWAFLLPVSLFLLGHFSIGVVEPLLSGDPVIKNSSTFALLARSLSVLIGVGAPVLFYKMKLITEVQEEGIYVYFSPFKHETISFDEIVSAEARTYTAFTEYGGWGIRQGPSGHAYNVSGDYGVQLELTDGKKLLIGSQRSEELAQIIQANQDDQ